MDSKDGGFSHTRAESMVLATSGHRDIGASGYGVSGYRGIGVFGVSELARLAELSELAELGELGGHAEL